jgi:hypothetical protein
VANDNKPHLVRLDEKPTSIRRSVYSDLVQAFANDPTMKYARVQDAKPTAVVAIKKAIARYRLSDVIAAYTSDGTVILEKK